MTTTKDFSTQISALADKLLGADNVVVLTGAGVSVPSGIPDFRTPGTGIWENVDPATVASIDVFRSDPERFWHFYGDRFATLGSKRPNPAHLAIAELEERGIVRAVITQNIDRLHRLAGTCSLVEMHGSIAETRCLSCAAVYDLAAVCGQLETKSVPTCSACGSDEALKPSIVLFGEELLDDAVDKAFDLCVEADLLVVIGSSLVVHPVAYLPAVATESGADLVILTNSPTNYDELASLKIEADAAEVMTALMATISSRE